jgi:hypothetical protein
MKRILGVLVLMAALASVALAVTGDSVASHQNCPASCPAGSGSCPMSCGR